MESHDFAALIVAGVAIIGMIIQQFTVISGIKERLSNLETKMDLFWSVVEKNMSEFLHSPDPAHARQDYLLERFSSRSLDLDEAVELRDKLNMKQEDNPHQIAGCLVLGRLAQIIHESRKQG